ncbi:MAG: homoserine O-acetyltransferase [bacterium]|nr:homoserine O-acetyltransferase [bacterium]
MAHTHTAFEGKNALKLESGQTLGPITQCYTTFGSLNATKSNAILVCHALTGDADADIWWKTLIGPGKAVDTNRYFIVCANVIGGCKGSTGPSSINPETDQPYGSDFPVITIGDMVNAQYNLMEHLNIPYWLSVIGGSMGGMQALEWAASYPDKVRSCIPLAATAQVSPTAIAFDAIGRSAISSDPNFNKGHFYGKAIPQKGLATARMIAHITYLSEQSIDSKFGRKLQDKSEYGYHFDTDFQIESYLKYQGDKFVDRFDANTYLYLTKAISYFDMPRKYGSLEKAFSATQAKFLVIAITTDWLYTPAQSKEFVKSLIRLDKEVTYAEMDSMNGHDAFLLEQPDLTDLVQLFLEKLNDN